MKKILSTLSDKLLPSKRNTIWTAMIAALGLAFGAGSALASRPLGIDVSSYQGSGVNWSSVKSSGRSFAWAKATEGATTTDADFTINESHGKVAGVVMGAYHFAHPNLNSPGTEASHFWGVAGGYIKADGKTLQPMLDMEVFSGVVGATSYSDWANQFNNAIVADAAAAGVHVVPSIYVSACAACNFNTSVAGWLVNVADYNGGNPLTGTPWTTCTSCEEWGSGAWDAWQYSSTGSVSGVSGNCDVDVVNGSSLSAWTATGGYSAPAMLYDLGNGSMNSYLWNSTGSSFIFDVSANRTGYDLANVGENVVSGDFNGDGLTDIATAYQYSDGSMRIHVFLNGDITSAGTWFTSGAFTMANVAGRMVAGDFNGDGKDDIAMMYDTGGGHMNIYRFFSTGSSFNAETDTYPNGYTLSNVGDNVAAADVNGDGKDDIIAAYQYPDGTMHLHVFFNGDGRVGASTWFTSGPFNLDAVNGRMVGGDFDGNGKGDVAMLYDTGGSMIAFRFLSSGTAFSYDQASLSGYDLTQVGKNVAAGKITAGGTTDIVAAYQYPDGTMRLHTFINGNSYSGSAGWYQSGTFNLNNVAGRMVMGNW
ncbi:MAG: GH25 family lysozyme [Limisphaerales bacterium]